MTGIFCCMKCPGEQTCEEASRIEVISFQGDAAGAHLLVEGQRLGSAGILHLDLWWIRRLSRLSADNPCSRRFSLSAQLMMIMTGVPANARYLLL